MAIPFKMGPTGDLLNFPYKESLFAYYYKDKFYLAPNRSYDELDTIQPGPTIIIHSIDNVYTGLSFGDGNHLTIRATCLVNGPHYFTGGGYNSNRGTNISTLENAIFGGGSAYYYYGYSPNNYNLSAGSGGDTTDKSKNAATNVKFGCCFDRKLSKNEFDEVAKWILATNP